MDTFLCVSFFSEFIFLRYIHKGELLVSHYVARVLALEIANLGFPNDQTNSLPLGSMGFKGLSCCARSLLGWWTCIAHTHTLILLGGRGDFWSNFRMLQVLSKLRSFQKY